MPGGDVTGVPYLFYQYSIVTINIKTIFRVGSAARVAEQAVTKSYHAGSNHFHFVRVW